MLYRIERKQKRFETPLAVIYAALNFERASVVSRTSSTFTGVFLIAFEKYRKVLTIRMTLDIIDS